MISKVIEYGNFDFILVDKGEKLSKDNYDKLLQLIWDKQIIITKVDKGNLKLEID